jgi:hypothetical protein
MIAIGFNQYRGEPSSTNRTFIMLSDDGGNHWFELGYQYQDYYRTTYGFDGIYNWPNNWKFYPVLGARFSFGKWFVVNGYNGAFFYGTSDHSADNGPNLPSILRISPSGRIVEPIHPPDQKLYHPCVIGSKGD